MTRQDERRRSETMEGATKTALLTDEMRAATRKVHGISDK